MVLQINRTADHDQTTLCKVNPTWMPWSNSSASVLHTDEPAANVSCHAIYSITVGYAPSPNNRPDCAAQVTEDCSVAILAVRCLGHPEETGTGRKAEVSLRY